MSSAPLAIAARARQHRMRGAAPLGLDEDLRLRQHAPRLVGDRLRVRPDHDGGHFGPGAAHRRQHMREQRAPGDRVQHLRQRRAHARALAGGEHDREAGSFAHRHLGEVRAVILSRDSQGKVESGDGRSQSTAGIAGFCYRFSRFDSRRSSPMTAVRRTQLARLGVWIGLATVAVLTAVLAARTETGDPPHREPAVAGAEAARTAKAPAARQPPLRPGSRAAAAERGDPPARRRPRPAARPRHHARAQSRRRDRLDRRARPRRPPQLPVPSVAAPPLPPPAAPPANPPARTNSRVAAGHLATGSPRRRVRSRPRPSSASISAAMRRSKACARCGRT